MTIVCTLPKVLNEEISILHYFVPGSSLNTEVLPWIDKNQEISLKIFSYEIKLLVIAPTNYHKFNINHV